MSSVHNSFQFPSTWTPSGDIRRDLFQLRSYYFNQSFPVNTIYNFNEKNRFHQEENTKLLDSVKYLLEKVENNHSESTNSLESVEDLSSISDKDLENVKVSFDIQNQTLFPQDILSLANALRVCAFKVESVNLLSVKLPSLILLSQALKYKKSLERFSIDFCKFPYILNENNQYSGDFKENSLQFLQQLNEASLIEDEIKKREEKAQATTKKGKDTQPEILPPNLSLSELNQSPYISTFMTFARHISLRGCSLSETDLESISNVLSKHPLIETLSLWGCNITDKGSICIANALRTNHSLKGIELGFNKITDLGAEAILQVFQSIEIEGVEALQILRLKAYESVYGSSNFENADKLPLPQVLITPILGPKGKPAKSNFSTISWDEEITILSAPEALTGKKGEEIDKKPYIFLVPGNRNIRYIGFSGNKNITDKTAQLIPKFTKDAAQFEKIALTDTGISLLQLEEALENLNENANTDKNL